MHSELAVDCMYVDRRPERACGVISSAVRWPCVASMEANQSEPRTERALSMAALHIGVQYQVSMYLSLTCR
jgi:hypothetical protein